MSPRPLARTHAIRLGVLLPLLTFLLSSFLAPHLSYPTALRTTSPPGSLISAALLSPSPLEMLEHPLFPLLLQETNPINHLETGSAADALRWPKALGLRGAAGRCNDGPGPAQLSRRWRRCRAGGAGSQPDICHSICFRDFAPPEVPPASSPTCRAPIPQLTSICTTPLLPP